MKALTITVLGERENVRDMAFLQAHVLFATLANQLAEHGIEYSLQLTEFEEEDDAEGLPEDP